MSHDLMVSLQHFFIRQSQNETQKGKSSLYNVSILKLLENKKENDTLSIIFVAKEKKIKDGVVLSVSGEDDLDIVLCVKASVHAHT